MLVAMASANPWGGYGGHGGHGGGYGGGHGGYGGGHGGGYGGGHGGYGGGHLSRKEEFLLNIPTFVIVAPWNSVQ